MSVVFHDATGTREIKQLLPLIQRYKGFFFLSILEWGIV